MSQVLLFLFFSGSFVLPGIYTTRRRRRRRRRKSDTRGENKKKKEEERNKPKSHGSPSIKSKGGKIEIDR
jgi:hypothetical protein